MRFKSIRCHIAMQSTSVIIQLVLAKYDSAHIKYVLSRNINISEETIVELLDNNHGIVGGWVIFHPPSSLASLQARWRIG